MINKKIIIVCFLFAVVTILCGCAMYKFVNPYQTYNHEKHEETLLGHGMDCFSCHIVDLNEPDPLKRLQMLKDKLKLDNDKRFNTKLCHQCHIDEKTKQNEAPSRCSFCHQNLNLVLPLDHKGLWPTTHGASATISDVACVNCHNKRFCIDCHNARDLTSSNAHPRAFRVSHFTAASADPASCGNCHVSSFCRDCHTK